MPSPGIDMQIFTRAFHRVPIAAALLGLLALLCSSCTPEQPTSFSKTEQNYLNHNSQKLEVLFGYEAPPNAYHDSENRYTGLLVDFLREIEQQAGIRFTFHNFKTWDELIEYSKKGRNFIVVGIAETEARNRYLKFTDPFIKIPYVIVSRTSSNLSSLSELTSKKVCTVANYAINDYLREYFPNLTPVGVQDNLAGLRGVSTGQFDAMIINQMYGSWLIEQQGITNLAISGESGYLNRLSAAVSVKDPVLFSIIEKSVDWISRERSRELYRKWLGQEPALLSTNMIIGILLLTGVAALLLTIFWIWNMSLQRKVKQRTSQIILSRERLRTTLNSIGDGVVTTDTSGRITAMNPVAEDISGWLEKDARTRPVSDVLACDLPQGSPNPFTEALKSNRRIIGKQPVLLDTKGGDKLHISYSAAPIRDAQGTRSGSVLILRDITEEHMVRKALSKNEEKFRSYIEKSPLGVALLDDSSFMLEINPALASVMEQPINRLKENPLKDYLPFHDSNRLLQALHQAEVEGAASLAVEFLPRSGTRGYGILDLVRLQDSRYLLFFNDITELRKIEEEVLKMQKLKSVGTLAGGIAHDFNNILMGIFGNLGLAREDISEDHPAYDSICRAEQSLNRATRLTRQLLTFSKGGEPLLDAINLSPLIEQSLQFVLAGSNVLPVTEYPESPWTILADPGQIEQVLSNLFINANQAMPDGGELHVRVENVEIDQSAALPLDSGRYVKTIISDSGTGIEPGHLERIFDPYFSTKQAGSGLGLATTFSIVSRHSGYIEVESTLGVGTTFSVYLPVAPETQDPERLETEPSRTEGSPHPRILVMDDETPILNLIQRMLGRQGYEVQTAEDGEAALAIYRQFVEKDEPFDIVILDLTIPGGMGGLETARELHRISPELTLLVSSGYSDDPVLASPGEYGFSGVISKPYTKDQLMKTIDQVFSQR